MIFTENNFIGTENFSKELKFAGGDDENVFKENCKTQPDNWYYRNIEITYKYNKNGHRCKDIENIDLDNYILFTGCSHTEGVGLELEKTYPYIISKSLNMDYYNLALGATGIDVLEYNLINWLTVVKKKPKILVVQWPDHTRFISLNFKYKNLIPKGTWSDDTETKKFIVAADISGFYNARKMITLRLVKKIYDPIYAINMSNIEKYDDNGNFWKKLDVARDLCHYGVQSNQKLADTFLNQYADKYLNARDNHDIRGQK
jgi:hypothetical protein